MLRVLAVDAKDFLRFNGKILVREGVDRTATAPAMREMIPFTVQPLLDRGETQQ